MTWAFPKPVKVEREPKRLNRGKPLERRTPLKSGGPIKASRAPVESDCPEYLEVVRGLGYCAAAKFFGREDECSGRLDPHHAGSRMDLELGAGTGQKVSDTTAIPLCRWHHRALERNFGPFHHWKKDRIRGWEDDRIAETRVAVLPLLDPELADALREVDALTPGSPSVAGESA